jgi:hypothetical protein
LWIERRAVGNAQRCPRAVAVRRSRTIHKSIAGLFAAAAQA